jgi:hypothetical protein
LHTVFPAPAWQPGIAASGTPNPFVQAGAPGAPTPGPVAGPYMPSVPGAAAAAYQPARLTPDAAARLAVLSAPGPAAPSAAAPPARLAPPAYASSAPPAASQAAVAPDPEADFNQANAEYDARLKALRQLDNAGGERSVYGPINPPAGWATARSTLERLVAEASQRRNAAEQAMKDYRYT